MNTEIDNQEEIEEIEEVENKAIKMKSAFFIVTGLHLLAVGGIFLLPTIKSYATEKEDKKFLLENAPIVGTDNVVEEKPKPTPLPKVIREVPNNISKNYPSNPIKKQSEKKEDKYVKEYVVQKGDTLNKIVKKYKVNKTELKKLNNIKDENKIFVGQKIKFL
jgi:LysM repeat protein